LLGYLARRQLKTYHHIFIRRRNLEEEVISMPKKPKTVEEHLEIIENLLAGIILKRSPTLK
jgi:hypothetical protein